MMEQYNTLNPEHALQNNAGNEQGQAQGDASLRKPYATPVLTAHGRFERLTLQASGTGASETGDDGSLGAT